MLDFGPTNRALRQALNMVWQMGLMEKSHGLMSERMLKSHELTKERQAEYLSGLGERDVARHGLTMTEIEERFQNDLARDNVVKQLRGAIHSKGRKGQDTSMEQDKLHKHLYNRALIALDVAKVSPQVASGMAQTLTESAFTSVLGQAATTARQERQITGVEEPKMAIERDKLGLQKAKFEREKLPLADYKVINSTKVEPLRRFLLKFVNPDTPETEKERLMREVGLTEETKKVFGGEITSERVYKLLSKLDKIGTRFLNNKGTSADLDWISRAYDIISIQKEFEKPIEEPEQITHPGLGKVPWTPTERPAKAELPAPQPTAMSARQIYIDELIRLGASGELAEKLANRRYGR